MAIHVHVERITKRPTESRAWPSGVLALNTIDLVLADVDAIIVKMITTTTVTSKTGAKNQLLVEGVGVAAHADRKLTNLVRCRAETENESQSVHALQKVLVARSCVRASTVVTLFVHVLSQLHQRQ